MYQGQNKTLTIHVWAAVSKWGDSAIRLFESIMEAEYDLYFHGKLVPFIEKRNSVKYLNDFNKITIQSTLPDAQKNSCVKTGLLGEILVYGKRNTFS